MRKQKRETKRVIGAVPHLTAGEARGRIEGLKVWRDGPLPGLDPADIAAGAIMRLAIDQRSTDPREIRDDLHGACVAFCTAIPAETIGAGFSADPDETHRLVLAWLHRCEKLAVDTVNNRREPERGSREEHLVAFWLLAVQNRFDPPADFAGVRAAFGVALKTANERTRADLDRAIGMFDGWMKDRRNRNHKKQDEARWEMAGDLLALPPDTPRGIDRNADGSMRIDIPRLAEALRLKSKRPLPTELDQPQGDDGATVGDGIADTKATDPASKVAADEAEIEIQRTLRDARQAVEDVAEKRMKRLHGKTWQAIRKRIDDLLDGAPLKEIADAEGVALSNLSRDWNTILEDLEDDPRVIALAEQISGD